MEKPGEDTLISPEVIEGIISDFKAWNGTPPRRIVYYDSETNTIKDGIPFRNYEG